MRLLQRQPVFPAAPVYPNDLLNQCTSVAKLETHFENGVHHSGPVEIPHLPFTIMEEVPPERYGHINTGLN